MLLLFLVVGMAIFAFFICFMAGADPRRKWPDMEDMSDVEQEIEIQKSDRKSNKKNKKD